MNKYGQPSRVWLESSSSYDTPGAGYGLWLFYDHLGFLIIYTGSVERTPMYHICPRFESGEDIMEVKLYLQSNESARALEALTHYYQASDYMKPIETAGITEEEFYSAFLEEENPCFDVPGKIFP